MFTPCGKAAVGVAVQLPLPSTTAVAITLPLASLMVMVASGSPVPLRVGVVSLVLLSPSVPLSLVAFRMAVGAAGASESMLMGSEVAALTLPAGSVAVTLRLFTPCGKAVVGVTLQLPLASTTAVWISPPGKVTVMVSPGVPPAPLMVGVVSLVMLSPKVPLSLTAAKAAAGALGAVVSMRNSLVLVSTLVEPKALVTVAVTG